MATLEELKARKQREALEMAIKILDTQGCKYKVITTEGEEFGVLAVEKERQRAPRRDLSKYDYQNKVGGMESGGVIVIKADDEGDLAALGACCSSYGVQKFGRGSVTYETFKDTLEVIVHRRF